MRAPTKPIATAAQRFGPTGSPRNFDDSAVTISGLVSEIDAADASGMYDDAVEIEIRRQEQQQAAHDLAAARCASWNSCQAGLRQEASPP